MFILNLKPAPVKARNLRMLMSRKVMHFVHVDRNLQSISDFEGMTTSTTDTNLESYERLECEGKYLLILTVRALEAVLSAMVSRFLYPTS